MIWLLSLVSNASYQRGSRGSRQITPVPGYSLSGTPQTPTCMERDKVKLTGFSGGIGTRYLIAILFGRIGSDCAHRNTDYLSSAARDWRNVAHDRACTAKLWGRADIFQITSEQTAMQRGWFYET